MKRERLIVLALAAAILVWLSLSLLAHSPRARMNVMQVASTLFFLAVIARHGFAKTEAQTQVRARASHRWGLLAALLLGGGLYAWLLPHYFLCDDFTLLWVAREPVLPALWDQLTQGSTGAWFRPLGVVSYALDFRLWGQWPAGYHLTNLVLHLATMTGVYFLAKGLGLAVETAAAAALVFAVQPIHAEAVTWMAARFDLFVTCFAVWSLVFYVRFRMGRGAGSLLVSLLLFLLAVLSKESAFVLPLLLLSVEFFFLQPRRLKPALGFVGLAALVFAYRWAVLGGIGGYPTREGQPAVLHFDLQTFEGLLIRGPAQMLLAFNWLEPGGTGLFVLASLTAASLLALVFVAKPGTCPRRWIWFCLGWMWISWLPVHSMLMISPALTNSRVHYLGSVGMAMLLAVLLAGLGSARMRRGSTLLLVLLFSLALLHNLRAWRWTSSLAHRLLVELRQLEPSPPPRTHFVFQDMPVAIRGVLFYPVGLTPAVNIAYGRRDLSTGLDPPPYPRAEPAPGGPTIKMKWRGESRGLIERVRGRSGEASGLE